MTDTRYASIDPRAAECRHPDEGFQLPTVEEIYNADETTIETEHYEPLRISHALSSYQANPDRTPNEQASVFMFFRKTCPLMSAHEIGALMDEAQTLYYIAQELHDCLRRALDTWDTEDRLDALASAQASQDGLEGVDVVEAVGEQLITEIREQEEPETW